ncbi:condensation domain-containing protein, partial [Kibdelosporangium lantanae]
MYASEPGPLSYGQLSEWRNVDTHPRERWHEANTWSRWHLPTGVATSAVRQALRALAARHLTLRTTYDLTDPANPRQVITPCEEAEFTVVECATPEEDEALSEAAMDRPFDLCAEVAWRAQVRTRGGSPTELLLVRHHIVADNWSDTVLEQDFVTLLGNTDLPPAPTPLDLATWQRSRNPAATHKH